MAQAMPTDRVLPSTRRYPAHFDILHIGFIQASREAVDAMHGRLSADGWETRQPYTAHGAWTFYFRAKGGYFIEVTTLTPVRPEEAHHGSPH